jgi:hypothetical protein
MKSFKLRTYATGEHGFDRALTISDDGCAISNTVFTDEELKCLMQTIQSVLPMEVCEGSDIKHLNRRLRAAEAKIVSLEGCVEELERWRARVCDSV